MRFSSIAVTTVAAFALSACGTLTSFMENFQGGDSSAAPVSSTNEAAASVGQVVFIDVVRAPGEGNSPEPIKPGDRPNRDQLLDVRMDNGDLRTVIQPPLGDVRLGDRVRLADGRVHRY